MKIGFDGKRAANNLTGLGNYSRSLIAELARHFPQNQYFVYTPKVKNHPQISRFLEDQHLKISLPDSAIPLWRSFGIQKQLQKDGIALFHGLSHEIPLGIRKTGISSVVTIHDLIFLKFPAYFGWIDRMIYKLKAQYACSHANRIIAISECTKRDIIEFFHTDPDKIEVVYQSCDDSFKAAPDLVWNEQVRQKHSLPERYILSVGTIETRKNLISLIKALPAIPDSHQLVVVGRKTGYMKLVIKELHRLNLSHRVTFLQNVPFRDLPPIYQMAEVFAYPSFYEGFGIPIIEALYSNVPVIAARGSCLEEAGGPSSLYVEPSDHEGLAAGINAIIGNSELRDRMKADGASYVKRFENSVITNQMMAIYEHLLSVKNNEHA